MSQIFSRVQGQEYDITYWDTLENAEKTIHCYTSNGSTDCYSGVVMNGLYQGAKFNAIEIAGELNSANIRPILTTTGNLIIDTADSPTFFTRSSDDLLYETFEEGLSFSIEGQDLIQYEE